MKFSLLLIAFLVLKSTSAVSQCADSTMVIINQSKDDDTPGSTLEYTSKYIKKFNTREKKILETSYRWLNGNWDPASRDSLFYINDTLVERQISLAWDSNQWKPFSMESYQYLNDSLLSSHVSLKWETGGWQIVSSRTITYNSAFLVTDSLVQSVNSSQHLTKVYDLFGNLLIRTQINTNSGQSQNVRRELHHYAGDDDTLLIIQNGINGDTTWYDNEQWRYSYDANHRRTMDEKATWNAGWQNQFQLYYYYAGNSTLPDSGLAYVWDTQNSLWKIDQKAYWTYNSSGKLLIEDYLYWDTYFWVEFERYIYQYNNDLLTYESHEFLDYAGLRFEYYFYYFYDVHGHYIGRDGYQIGFGSSGSGASYSFDANGIYTNADGWWSTMGGFTGSWATQIYYNEIYGQNVFCDSGFTTLYVDSCLGATYHWSTGSANPSISVFGPGNYTVNVVYPDGYHTYTAPIIATTQSASIFVPAGDSLLYQCGDYPFRLQVPAQSYTFYNWNRNDTLLAGHTSALLSSYYMNPPNLPGTYYLVASNYCGIDTSARTHVVRAELPNDSVIINVPIPFCNGDSATLTAMPGYTYHWYPTDDSTQSITIYNGGNYYLYVTDTTGCTNTNGFNVQSYNLPDTPVIYQDGPNIILNDSLYTYWFRNDTLIPGNQLIYAPTSDGYYQVKKILPIGCSSDSDSLLFIMGALTAQAGLNRSFCDGDSVVIGGNYTAWGGTPPYQIQWTPSLGLSSDTARNPNCFANTNQIYTLVITDSLGNSASDSVSVIVHPTPQATITHDPVPACYTYNFSLLALPAGLSNYQWTKNGVLYSNSSWNGLSVSQGGIYQVKIKTAYGCESLSVPDTISFYSYPNFIQLSPSGTQPLCIGDSLLIQLTTDTSLTFEWFINDTAFYPVNDTLFYANRKAFYKVIGTDRNGCTTSNQIYVDIDSVLHISIYSGSDVYQCMDDSIYLTTSNSSGYTYQWQMNGVNISGANNYEYIPLSSASYSVFVQSPSGCSGLSTATTVHLYPALSGTVNVHNDTLSVDNTGNYYIWWSDLAGNFLGYGDLPVPSLPGDYIITMRDPVTNCSADMFYHYTPCPVSFVNTLPSCPDSIGQIEIIANGIPPFTYLWSDGNTDSVRNSLSPGVYYFTVTDSSGCIESINDTLISISGIQIDSILSLADCSFTCNDSLFVLVSGQLGATNYLWQDSSMASFFPDACSGNYSINVSDSLGCAAEKTFSYIEPLALSVSDSIVSPGCGGCANGSILLTISNGQPPYTITWQPPIGTLSGNAINDLPASSYTIVVVDQVGCEFTFMDSLPDLFTQIKETGTPSWQVFPNPFSDATTFKFSGNRKEIRITLRDPLCRIVRFLEVKSNTATIRKDELKPGIYFYFLTAGVDPIGEGKLVIE